MKKVVVAGINLLIILMMISCSGEQMMDVKINSDWKFKRLKASDNAEEKYYLSDYDDASWERVSLPHTANVEPLVVNDQWQGTCWYRKSFAVPEVNEAKKVVLELEAAMNYSQIWINGVQVAEHQGGYLPVVVDATPYVKAGQDNILAIRLNNTDNAITGPKPLHKLDFNMYGGLYRNAWLRLKDEVYISHPVLANKEAGGGVFITYPTVSERQSVVQIKTHVVNDAADQKQVHVVQSIYYQDSLVATQSSETFAVAGGKDIESVVRITLDRPRLWSPEVPNLYALKTEVMADGKLVDHQTERFGIRDFVFDDNNELYINGKKTFLRGVNRHQEYPFVGYAMSDNAQYRDAKKIKDAGFNFIRLSHYPHSPAFMDACDELGLVVIDAILGWQYYLDNDQFRAYCYRSAKELVLRDRNRPSVLAWEVSLNETQMPIFFMEELHRIVHAEMPGQNVYTCGWKPEVYDIYLQARQHRILHHYDSIQTKPYEVSEYGDWEYYSNNAGLNQDQLPKNLRIEKCSRQLRGFGEKRLLYQATNVQEAHNDNMNTPAFGDSYWVMYDYNRGYYDNIEASGIMDIFRIPKFAYYFYQSQQEPEDQVVLQIASWWTEESPLDVRVFSNCDEVALYLNDEQIGKQQPNQDSISYNLNHPPFTFSLPEFVAGTLKAVGYIDGKPVAEHLVKTPGKVAGLKMWLDESGKAPQAGVNDVLFLYIAAVDEQGIVIPAYDQPIDVSVLGDAEIMNVGAVQAEAGIATALIRVGTAQGKVTMKATAVGLPNKEFSFEVNQ
ncbi:glycoside hydrolase family 2 protein [Reichenbachiella carrageenanivorans]|uniref:Glycoside hydrolase family 2 protein n=1 Tax=Reichenbachiella carrageenanivorans TaxID=2979869 RepID=A0ABY6D4L0_9BACT|nr:glycoside hydrolase family 2 protein [Reichenbachiella carrageenanivorans]UXX81092.1 glycoside hydrolase family 2 protein [Reichenbachiella carrageenanivorans]